MSLMKTFTTTVLAAGIAAATLAADPALVIPAAGWGPGAAESLWRSEVTLHNAGNIPIPVEVVFHSPTGEQTSGVIEVGPRQTVSSPNIVRDELGLSEAFGALTLNSTSIHLPKLVVTSRIVNSSTAGEFGQAVPVSPSNTSLVAGDIGVILGPQEISAYRLNFGLFVLDDTTIDWKLLRNDGTVAAQRTESYDAGVWTQYNLGISSFFGQEPGENDTVHALLLNGRAFVYGSMVNSGSGDPSWISANRTRENLAPQVLGIDRNQNGVIDFIDANGDGIIDSQIELAAGRFPNYFIVMAVDPEGADLTFSLVNPSPDVALLENGMIQWYPGANLIGQTGSLTVRVSDGLDHTDIVIPVVFR